MNPNPNIRDLTPYEKWQQRLSFVYGNASLSNPDITRDMVENQMIDRYGPCPPKPLDQTPVSASGENVWNFSTPKKG
jgi:hypothetical protein